MTILINLGSGGIAASGDGWTNTVETAVKLAREWHERMIADGIADVELNETPVCEKEGRWEFIFKHRLTGVEVTLKTHGIDNMDAYTNMNVYPRVYWNGSSSGQPSVEDFAAPGWRVHCSFVKETT
jgi:hypothetical protein